MPPHGTVAFHNRLTHVLKVAQIGRRLAERLSLETDHALIEQLGGLDPAVVEAACLAHDLGHPPFGHVIEHKLQELGDTTGLKDSFEGNAQSFRIVTRLEHHDRKYDGLNLTRATLNAVLKYPSRRNPDFEDGEKWGAYDDDGESFDFAREGASTGEPSIEAAIMDWADDIAYSVHDLQDFYRAGLIPLDRLATSGPDEATEFLDAVFSRRGLDAGLREGYEHLFRETVTPSLVNAPFKPNKDDEVSLQQYGSWLIGRLFDATSITAQGLEIKPEIKIKVMLLKELIWEYVILRPTLASKQFGQRRMIEELFDIYLAAAESRFSSDADSEDTTYIFPADFRQILQKRPNLNPARFVMDLISQMTEQEAVRMHQRLTGNDLHADVWE